MNILIITDEYHVLKYIQSFISNHDLHTAHDCSVSSVKNYLDTENIDIILFHRIRSKLHNFIGIFSPNSNFLENKDSEIVLMQNTNVVINKNIKYLKNLNYKGEILIKPFLSEDLNEFLVDLEVKGLNYENKPVFELEFNEV